MQAMNTGIPSAHCGYLDIYLDGGLFGLFLLFPVSGRFGKAPCPAKFPCGQLPGIEVRRADRHDSLQSFRINVCKTESYLVYDPAGLVD